MKKIAFFNVGLGGGGAERIAINLIQELQSEYEVHIIIIINNIEYEIPKNVKIYSLGGGNYEDSNLKKLLMIPVWAFRLAKYIKSSKIEACLSFNNRTNYILILSQIFKQHCKTLIVEQIDIQMVNRFNQLASFVTKLMIKLLYNRADGIITASQRLAQLLRKNFQITINIKTLYNSVNSEKIKKLSESELDQNFLENKFNFIHVGRFFPQKNHLNLIEAFSKLKYEDTQLVLLGKGGIEGDTFKQSKNLVEELGLQSRVIFVGFDNNPFKYLKKSHVFVLSSDFEGLPMVILEAMSIGLPVISTDCSTGPREILAPTTDFSYVNSNDVEIADYGVIVPINQPVLLAEAMELLYCNKELRESLSDKSLIRVKDFDIKQISKGYIDVINKLLVSN